MTLEQEIMAKYGVTPADMGEETLKDKYLAIVDNYLNETVKAREYDSILSACSYADDDTDKVFQQEGIACRKWRSMVYRKCYDILAEVESGKREIPADIISELPKLEW